MKIRVLNKYDISIASSYALNSKLWDISNIVINKNLVIIADTNISHEKINHITAQFNAQGYKCHVHILEKFGEEIKTMRFFEETALAILPFITRKTTIISIGGGTVGDLSGFLASTIMRGVGFIQIPTTLLAMVDSAVGGKVGINLGEYKNAIGAFHQPRAVLCDVDFLQTLPKDEILSGYGEIIKYGIGFDKNFLQSLLDAPLQNFEYMIKKSCEIKARIVSDDEFEQNGTRELLNFGHTFGHAFELESGQKHGICVMIGMIFAMKYSIISGYWNGTEFDQILAHCDSIQMPIKVNGIPAIKMLRAMTHDKKNTQEDCIKIDGESFRKTTRLILLKQLGEVFATDVPTIDLYEFLKNTL